MSTYTIRPAQSGDVPAIADLIAELAEFENLTHMLQLTADKLHPHLFGAKPVVEALVGEIEGEMVGFALFFTNFSTFLAKPGLYLEDLYVRPAHRRSGLGKGLLKRLAAIAVERDYGRFDWTVLDWNEDAIRFYEKMGASVLPEWRICRMTGEALTEFAGQR
ncbi:GNAT family N-acetyltransferase [Paucibacter sp. PLA-PC-4]|uniref:GNAT family N-acetyltransferase n=1 Tax=Paucibacter sp. PLA-PC-4 TaxID=2993655 RepID=UPI00224993E9|nr:GNAT family N-acetyltransferase [Paucibacter sp. PLA-PC-4]MCX2861022.1 GNAT family N-acetyltransferase [Paucibacter sp. PLA-PC-4]